MATVTRTISTTCDDVWRVLADGWLYPLWVVGATRIREVDDTWPAPGSQPHHSVGAWPLVINDSTEVRASEPARRLLLRARGWPLGEAEVDMRLDAGAGGCAVTMHETLVAGPGLGVLNPVTDRALALRNTETLHRLARLAEGRAARS